MAKYLAVAGKGGTGKTTFAALLIRYLIESHKGSILAVDADANANLNEALGLGVTSYISDVLEQTKDPKAIPSGMTKQMFIDYRLAQCLVETRDVDLLVMGRPNGPGCYCYPNDLLRRQLSTLSKNYDYVVIDNEAGMEHISRRIIPEVSHLFIISDGSVRGIRSAGRVHELVKSLKFKVGTICLVVTRVDKGNLVKLADEIEQTGLNLVGTIPQDSHITEYDAVGKPLFDLPSESPALRALCDILDKMQL